MVSGLHVREVKESDFELIVQYWLGSSAQHLTAMGVDLEKLPTREQLLQMLSEQVCQPYGKKTSYALIWEMDSNPVGHCNVNKIVFGKEAHMHLHMWDAENRQKGMGRQLVELSLPFFFNNLKIDVLYCEPYSLNTAPNRTLENVGFGLVKEYVTTPGYLNFEQPVKRWRITKEGANKM